MNRNVTMIAELPDLEDLEPQIQKHIRVHKKPVDMEVVNQQPPIVQQPPQQQLLPQYQHEQQVNYDASQPQTETISPSQYYCIDVAKHIQMCPICSRFYHNDKTIYIVIIVVLVLICLMMLKKILNV